MEGVIEGTTSIALSLTSFTQQNFQPAAEFAKVLLDHLITHPFPQTLLLNVNIPAMPREQIKGVVMTRQGIRRYHDMFEKRIDPRGKTYYWLAGEVMEEVDEFGPEASHSPLLTDVQAIRQNLITLTPLHYNLTAHQPLENLVHWLEPFKLDDFDP